MSVISGRRQVTSCEWWTRVRANCGTISGHYWPTSAAEAYEYTCKATDFDSASIYLVRFTTRDRSRIVDWSHSEATPITIREFCQNSQFVKDLLGNWGNGTPVRSAQLLGHSCTTCHRTIVIDGVHRIVHIMMNSVNDADLYVTELTGAAWPVGMPDMSKVCACATKIS